MSTKRMYRDCKRHLYRYVQICTVDGRTMEGFIEHVDRDHVYMLVPMEEEVREDGLDENTENDNRQYPGYGYPGYGYPGYGYPGYGYPGYGYPGYGYPGYGYHRPLRRLIVPLIFLTALSVLH